MQVSDWLKCQSNTIGQVRVSISIYCPLILSRGTSANATVCSSIQYFFLRVSELFFPFTDMMFLQGMEVVFKVSLFP